MSQIIMSDHIALVIHAYLLSGDVLATMAVGIGILWESDALTLRHEVAHKLVLWGVVLETVCSLALFAFDEAIGNAQQAKIIALEERLLPRSLHADAQERIAAQVCPLGPKPFDELLVSGDDQLFMGQVENIWKRCKWTPVGIADRDQVIRSVADSMGVRFLYDPQNPDFKNAAVAFAGGLIAEGITATAEPTPPDTKLNANVIHIIMGSRP